MDTTGGARSSSSSQALAAGLCHESGPRGDGAEQQTTPAAAAPLLSPMEVADGSSDQTGAAPRGKSKASNNTYKVLALVRRRRPQGASRSWCALEPAWVSGYDARRMRRGVCGARV